MVRINSSEPKDIYKEVKEEISVSESGVTSVINKMFGSSIVCDSATMFGDKAVIDDNLLYEIANTVCLAVEKNEITKEQAGAVLDPVFELHSKIGDDRFDRVVGLGMSATYQLLSDDKMRGGLDDFQKQWDKSTANLGTRRQAIPLFQQKVVPGVFSVCGVQSEVVIEDTASAGVLNRVAYTERKVSNFKPQCRMIFYFSDKNCTEKSAISWTSTAYHESFHCLQLNDALKFRKRYCNVWGHNSASTQIPEVIIWNSMGIGKYSIEANLNNPMEQEAYSFQHTFLHFADKYYSSDSESEKKKVLKELQSPCTKTARSAIESDVYTHFERNLNASRQR